MLWTSAFLLALAVAQVPAESVSYDEINDIDDDVSDLDSNIEPEWEKRPDQSSFHAHLRIIDAAGLVSDCGGAVVHAVWVLTAAHCTARQMAIIVRAGFVPHADAQYVAESRRWYNYPSFVDQWVHTVQPNDIALVELPRAIPFNGGVRPIQVHYSWDPFTDFNNVVLYTSGLGRTWTPGANTTQVHKVHFRGVLNWRCQELLGGVGGSTTDNSMCAPLLNGTQSSLDTTCYVSGGAPLVFEDRGQPVLVGLTSFVVGELVGIGGCHYGYAASFTRTFPFHTWFTQVTGIGFAHLHTSTLPEPTSTPPWWQTSWAYSWPTASPTVPPTAPPTARPTAPPTAPHTRPPPTWAPLTTTWAPATEPEPDVEPEEEDSDSASEEDPELLKRLEVKVKVKLSKYGSHKEVHHNKTVIHHRHH